MIWLPFLGGTTLRTGGEWVRDHDYEPHTKWHDHPGNQWSVDSVDGWNITNVISVISCPIPNPNLLPMPYLGIQNSGTPTKKTWNGWKQLRFLQASKSFRGGLLRDLPRCYRFHWADIYMAAFFVRRDSLTPSEKLQVPGDSKWLVWSPNVGGHKQPFQEVT